MGARSEAVASALLRAGADVLVRMQPVKELPVRAVTGVEAADAQLSTTDDAATSRNEAMTAFSDKVSMRIVIFV
jgi:hypothetical protein